MYSFKYTLRPNISVIRLRMPQGLGGEHTLGPSAGRNGKRCEKTGWPIWGHRLMDVRLELLVRIPMEVRCNMVITIL